MNAGEFDKWNIEGAICDPTTEFISGTGGWEAIAKVHIFMARMAFDLIDCYEDSLQVM